MFGSKSPIIYNIPYVARKKRMGVTRGNLLLFCLKSFLPREIPDKAKCCCAWSLLCTLNLCTQEVETRGL